MAAADAYIQATNLNIGSLTTNGVDLDVRYGTEIGGYGSLSFSLVGTYLMELIDRTHRGCRLDRRLRLRRTLRLGLRHAESGMASHRARDLEHAVERRPVAGLALLRLRHCSTTRPANPLLSGTVNDVDKELDAQNYIDVAATWNFLENYEVRFGINNVMDDDPPVSAQVGAGAGNGNTYPQVYDALGRYMFMGLTAKF